MAARIDNPSTKAKALGVVAKAAAQVAGATKNTELLKQAAEAGARVGDPSSKAALAVAKAAAQIGEVSTAAELLKQAGEVAARIDNHPSFKATALAEVAKKAAKLGHWRQARDFAARNSNDKGRAMALIGILQTWPGVDEKPTYNEIDE